jgi:hypothetical protein
MSVSTIYGPTEAAAARALIGGDVIADNRNELLKQIVVAVANQTGGGGGASTFAALTDKATADIPAINAPLATALGLRLLASSNLSDLASASTARTNLGVTATGADTAYAFRANNLSDLASVSTARSNLGLGTLATQAASAVAITGGTATGLTGLGLRNAGTGAFDLTLAHNGTLTAGKSLTLNVNDASRSVSLSGNLSFVNDFTCAGNFATTLTATATTNATLPAGTQKLAALGLAQTFTAEQTLAPSGGTAANALTANGRCVIASDGSGFDLRFGSSGMYLSNISNNRISTYSAAGVNGVIIWSGGDVTLVQNAAALSFRNGGTQLYSDANNSISQRNSTNAQTQLTYGTYTDASNYVRASLAATSTAVTLAAETLGTGADNIPVNITTAGTGLTDFTNQAASVDAAVVSTHSARMKFGGVEYKIMLATP